MSNEDHIKAVEVYAGDIVEVGMVKGLLESSDIQAYLKDEFQGMIAPWVITPGGAGAIKVLVSSVDFEKAKQIVDEYKQNVKE